jgi:hypothetical protein
MGFGARRDAGSPQQREDPARDSLRPAFARAKRAVLGENMAVIVVQRVRPRFLGEGDRDDEESGLVGDRNPRAAIIRAVAALAVLHDHHRLVGRVRRGPVAFQDQRAIRVERVEVRNRRAAVARERFRQILRCHRALLSPASMV